MIYKVQKISKTKGKRYTVRYMRTLSNAQEYAKKLCNLYSTYPREKIVKEGNIQDGLYFSGNNTDKRAGRIVLDNQ